MIATQITSAETPVTEVMCLLQERLPTIAFASSDGRSLHGQPADALANNAIGLLSNRPFSEQYPPGKIPAIPRRRFIGVLWFSNEAVGACNGKWVLEVYSANQLNCMMAVTRQLAQKFENTVYVKTVFENERYEVLPSDDQ